MELNLLKRKLGSSASRTVDLLSTFSRRKTSSLTVVLTGWILGARGSMTETNLVTGLEADFFEQARKGGNSDGRVLGRYCRATLNLQGSVSTPLQKRCRVHERDILAPR